MAELAIQVLTDLPAQTSVKVVGSPAELGSWNIDTAPELKFDAASGRFAGRIALPKSSLSGEFKLAARNPYKPEQGWTWLPGPNRPVGAALAGGEPVTISWITSRDGTAVVGSDAYLEPFKGHLQHRYKLFSEALAAIEAQGGGLDRFSRGWEYFGFNRTVRDGVPGVIYREWAPTARSVSLVGDFNGWDNAATPCLKDEFGVFHCFLPDSAGGTPAIAHNTFLKLALVTAAGELVYRVPAWTRYAVYDKALNEYVAKYWNPPAEERHAWRFARPTTHVAAEDYRAVPGIQALPSYTDWAGQVAPTEDRAAAGGAAAALGAGGGSTVSRPAAAATVAVGAAVATAKIGQPPQTAAGGKGGHRDPFASSLDSPPAAAAAGATARRGVTGSAAAPTSGRDPAHAGLRIYEAHVGMSSAEEKVNSYRDFADSVLPRIARLGYNCVQLMAIMEHAYYGSFGYHVTSFLAPSSRFGTPEDLKYLVDTAHGLGLLIIMDLVHSHAAKNVNDGINMFDGSDHQYFHSGARGNHDLWDSRLFDYSKLEVQRFLLSSARLYVEEFRFDGYRFDGVTSMMYLHHGLSYGFSGGYHEYFGDHTDLSAVVYLMLANHMLHTMSPPCISIAEDVSGMPTLGRPVWEGGVGFDYRLAMAIPDKWIKILKEVKDDDWDMANITFTLTNRRWQEKTIAYAESHDQALVGDKTLAFWLMDKEMYWHMTKLEKPIHPVVDRGLALHKMIRLLTYALGGDGYLNFMGNEFGHPEWIDFPREGNSWSYKHCRRQWNLADDDMLHYKGLNEFDAAMHHLEDHFPWLVSRDNYVSLKHEGDKMIVFDRGTAQGPLLFVFNFHPTKSYTDYRVGAPCTGEWELALDSDWSQFGGYNRVDASTTFHGDPMGWNERPASLQVYSPCRTVQVYKRKGTGGAPAAGGAGRSGAAPAIAGAGAGAAM